MKITAKTGKILCALILGGCLIGSTDQIAGDLNADKTVTDADAALLTSYLTGNPDQSVDYALADLNGDQSLDARDLTLLLQKNGFWSQKVLFIPVTQPFTAAGTRADVRCSIPFRMTSGLLQ